MASDEKIKNHKPTADEIRLFASTRKDVYIDPKTDFGFKRLFGDKELMKSFLTSVLGISIVDLRYGNTVKTGNSNKERTAIFDLFCTTRNKDQIIVEMQVLRHDNYKERTVFYASRTIQAQAKRGKWDFGLCPVYVVSIVNFCLDENDENADYASHIQLINRKTQKVFYDKLNLVYLELPRFNKAEKDLKTLEEKWMFALKHLPELDKLPKKLKIKTFERFFELAEIAQMTQEEQSNYYKSLYDMSLIDIQFGKMEKKIAEKDKTISALQKKIAEYERRLGLSGVIRPTKVRARGSAKSRTIADNW